MSVRCASTRLRISKRSAADPVLQKNLPPGISGRRIFCYSIARMALLGLAPTAWATTWLSCITTKVGMLMHSDLHRSEYWPKLSANLCTQGKGEYNSMEEDVRNTVLVIKNYDGENLGEFRKNLATYGAVKVRTVEGAEGGVEALTVDVSVDNYKAVIELLKKAIIENAKGYDAKDDRLSGNPNQMNIQSMYSDIDLDANCMETEFQAAFEDLLFFVNSYFANAGIGNFENEKVNVIFNRDILINEGEAIANCGESRGLISDETIIKMHPWVDDPIAEVARISAEKESAAALTDSYGGMFANADTGGTGNEKQ